MGDIPRELLCSLIRQQGISIIHDPKNFPNFLNDYYKGQYKKERKCLTDALLEDVPKILLNKKDQLAYATISQQLAQKLNNNLGITPELAKWTVDSWAIAIGIIRDVDLLPKDYVISINSTPQGAKVSLNGILKGVTPLTLKNPEFNSYLIQISNDGYELWIQSFNIDSRNDLKITATLTKKPVESGSITIETYPSNAEIYLNSKKYGRTPKDIVNLSDGYYEIRLVLPGYKNITFYKQVQAGINTKIRESFIPELEKTPISNPGKITVDSVPSRAAVYLDDQFVGNTPLVVKDVAPGNHSVAIRLSSYGEFRDQFRISQGEDRFILETLVKQKLSFTTKVLLVLLVCCAIGLSFFLIGMFFPFSDPNAAAEWNKKGEEFYNNGNYQEALDAFNKAISSDQNNVVAWVNKGLSLYKLGRYQEALDAYNKAISIDPNDKYTWDNKGNALYDLGRYQEALDAYNKAISIDPNFQYAWNGKGYALYHLERYQEALDAYNKAISIGPNLKSAWSNKGNALLNLERYREALDAYDKAISIDPNDKYAWRGKGSALYNLGRDQEALDAYNKALSIDPNDKYAWRGKGNALYGLGRDQEARDAVNKAL